MKPQKQAVFFAKNICAALAVISILCACAPAKVDAQIVRGIPYADHPESDPNLTSLDVYSPKGKSACPVILWVHGGGWQTGDKTDLIEQKSQYFVAKDFVFVSVNHRLFPDSQFPLFVQDGADAIAWTLGNISQYGGDADRLILVGFSSGAHIVSLIAANPEYLAGHNLAPANLDAVISVDSAAYDLPLLTKYYKGKLEGTHGAVFGNDPEIWKAASPITFLKKSSQIPPMLLVYSRGVKDDQVNPNLREQAEVFSRALQRIGAKAKVAAFPKRTHQELDQNLGRWNDPLTREILKFLRDIEGLDLSCRAQSQ